MTEDEKTLTGRERERDRGNAADTGMFEAAESDLPYLGDPGEVEAILRDFFLTVIGIRQRGGTSAITADDAFAQLEAACDRVAAIFYGKADGYRAMPFNSYGGVGRFAKERTGIDEPLHRALPVLLMASAVAIFEAHDAFVEDRITEDAARFTVEAEIDGLSRIMLGLPSGEAPTS
jgi:hypothetical protein